MPKKELAGQKFGKLTVTKDSGKRAPNGGILWECQCDCGNIVNVIGSNLTRKKHPTQSCGCKTGAKDLSGLKFGSLTAIKPTEKRVNCKVVWECKCDCGEIHYAHSSNLLNGSVRSCGKCSISQGESKVKEILKANNIEFETQKTFPSCRFADTKALARFDFYLPQYNILIEYDGKQHFQQANNWEPLERIQFRDNYKNQWCEENNISLIRIPYTQYTKLTTKYLLNLIKDVS